MNHIDFIIQVETQGFDPEQDAQGLQAMIDDGIVWSLQGFWGRLAAAAIAAGICVDSEGKGPAAA